MIDRRRDTGGGTAWVVWWVLKLLYTSKESFYTYSMSFPFVTMIFYSFVYARFGAYIYRLNKILEDINEIDPQLNLNQQTEKITASRHMKDRYKYNLQGNLRPHRENKMKNDEKKKKSETTIRARLKNKEEKDKAFIFPTNLTLRAQLGAIPGY